MTDVQVTPVGSAPNGELVAIKTVVAANIVAALGLAQTYESVKSVEQHINDELAAVQTHFALAMVDVQQTYHDALAEARTAVGYAKANKLLVSSVLGAVFALGALLGHFV